MHIKELIFHLLSYENVLPEVSVKDKISFVICSRYIKPWSFAPSIQLAPSHLHLREIGTSDSLVVKRMDDDTFVTHESCVTECEGGEHISDPIF